MRSVRTHEKDTRSMAPAGKGEKPEPRARQSNVEKGGGGEKSKPIAKSKYGEAHKKPGYKIDNQISNLEKRSST